MTDADSELPLMRDSTAANDDVNNGSSASEPIASAVPEAADGLAETVPVVDKAIQQVGDDQGSAAAADKHTADTAEQELEGEESAATFDSHQTEDSSAVDDSAASANAAEAAVEEPAAKLARLSPTAGEKTPEQCSNGMLDSGESKTATTASGDVELPSTSVEAAKADKVLADGSEEPAKTADEAASQPPAQDKEQQPTKFLGSAMTGLDDILANTESIDVEQYQAHHAPRKLPPPPPPPPAPPVHP
uniref:Skin secretory protein xP2-like n=2 Tax=Macrostomum lignano TaxID=282301 RepID=A0A1I8HQ64_9PLAT